MILHVYYLSSVSLRPMPVRVYACICVRMHAWMDGWMGMYARLHEDMFRIGTCCILVPGNECGCLLER